MDQQMYDRFDSVRPSEPVKYSSMHEHIGTHTHTPIEDKKLPQLILNIEQTIYSNYNMVYIYIYYIYRKQK